MICVAFSVSKRNRKVCSLRACFRLLLNVPFYFWYWFSTLFCSPRSENILSRAPHSLTPLLFNLPTPPLLLGAVSFVCWIVLWMEGYSVPAFALHQWETTRKALVGGVGLGEGLLRRYRWGLSHNTCGACDSLQKAGRRSKQVPFLGRARNSLQL